MVKHLSRLRGNGSLYAVTNCTGMCHFVDVCIRFNDFCTGMVNLWVDIAGHTD